MRILLAVVPLAMSAPVLAQAPGNNGDMVSLQAAAGAATAASAVVPAQAAPGRPGAVVTTASGLRFEVLAPGRGRRPLARDTVTVTYEVRLADGRLVESTPRPETLPVTGMIDGFTEALLMMNQGGRYRFWVPPALGYGAQGIPGSVPPNAELVFTLTLNRITRAPPRTIR